MLNIIAHNLVVQMRLLKKAKEKRNQTKTTKSSSKNEDKPVNSSGGSNSNGSSMPTVAQNETNLIELFFDLEAEIEKGFCRDQISFDSADREHGTLIFFKEKNLYQVFFSFKTY